MRYQQVLALCLLACCATALAREKKGEHVLMPCDCYLCLAAPSKGLHSSGAVQAVTAVHTVPRVPESRLFTHNRPHTAASTPAIPDEVTRTVH